MDVEPPIVVVTKNIPKTHYGIYFPGEPYIFVNAWVSNEQKWETEVHETVHYLQYFLKRITHRCQTENDARALAALILNTEYDHTWRKRYACEGVWYYEPLWINIIGL